MTSTGNPFGPGAFLFFKAPAAYISSASVKGGTSRSSGIFGPTDRLECVGNRVSTIANKFRRNIGEIAVAVSAPLDRTPKL